MSEQNDDFAQLLAIVNEEEDEVEEMTEEEIQQALNSPTLHQNAIECDEESTECDEYENSDSFKFDKNNNSKNNDNKGTEKKSYSPQESGSSQKRNEYQFQMMDHHIFKGKHGKKLYKCDVCYAVYRHSFSLKRHFIRSHINYGYLCETDVTNCGINLASSASLQTWNAQNSDNHLDRSDSDLPELYCCHSCVLFYDELSQIKSHVDDCHRNTKSGSIEPIRIPCSQCNMSFIQRHNLMRHIEVVHHGRKLYGCKQCGQKFQTIADRKKHEKSQHQIKQSDESIPSNKTHACVRCSQIYFNYSDLRKHVSKKHKECYNPCAFCNKFTFNKKQLSEHLRQRHEKTPKDNLEKLKFKKGLPLRVDSRVDQSSSKTSAAMPSNSISSQNLHHSQAYFHCSLCYRRFLTYGSLIRHKQIAHRPQVRHCSRLTTETQIDHEIIEPFNNTKEIEFYRTIAQRVAENLLYFVDGKFINFRNSSDNEVIPYSKRNVEINNKTDSEFNLSKYNFPENYNCLSPPPANSEKLEFLLDCNLNTVPNNKIDIICTSEETTEITTPPSKPMFICTACHEKISPELFADHEANNHPNVYCTYVEVDPLRNIPSQLLLWQYHCADGLLHRCPVAPSLTKAQSDSNLSLKCTKCTKSFASVSLLHNHILECAHNNSSKKKSIINSNSNHNNNNININNSIITTTATITPSDTNTNNNNNLLSSNVEKATDFPSPLSPCKTRSGKRRQISPEDVKTKKSKTSKNFENDSKQTQKDFTISENKVQFIDSNENNNQRMQNKSIDEEKSSEVISNESPNEENSSKLAENVPKRYACKKCTKKFVYMDSLKKHQLSCKRIFNSKRSGKRNLKQNKTLALKIEIKAIKNIQKNEEKKKKVSKQTALPLKSTTSVVKLATNTELKEETQESVEEIESNDKNDSSSMTWTPNTTNIPKITESLTKVNHQNSETINSSTNDISNNSLQEHRCPDCLRVFTYTANFRKHIKNVCPVRKQLGNGSTSTDSSLITSTPIQKSIKQTTVTEVSNIVIKQEKPEIDEQIQNNAEVIADEEIVFEGETPVEEEDDVIDISMSSKDDSKLDLWRVKQENPMFAFKGSPAQHHSCPYCQRGFTYLANYRKHIKSICPIRQQIEEKKKQVIEDSNEQEVNGVKVKSELSVPTVVYTPSSLSIRSQIEDTVLTLLRDQTKQDQILQSSEELVKSKSADESVQSSGTDIAINSSNASNETEISDESKSTESDKTKDKKKETPSPGKGSSYRFRTFSCSICHKIFLSYVTMLKHRLSHKLSDGSANDDNNNSSTNQSITTTISDNNNQLIQVNHDKEIQNQALAASLLKRSKETIFCKMRGNAISANNSNNINSNKPVINTTELLEKLARGGITTESLQLNKSKENGQELVVETNDNSNTFNLQLSASTSNSSANNNNNSNANNLQEIIIDANNLNDIELGVLKDGVIVQDLQQLIVGESSKVPVNEVLLDIDPNEIGNANELWITFTDSSAFVQVPQNNNNISNNKNNDSD